MTNVKIGVLTSARYMLCNSVKKKGNPIPEAEVPTGITQRLSLPTISQSVPVHAKLPSEPMHYRSIPGSLPLLHLCCTCCSCALQCGTHSSCCCFGSRFFVAR